VLGHERCGAVQAALEIVQQNADFPAAIEDMVSAIVPAVLRARSQRSDLLSNAVRENVRGWLPAREPAVIFQERWCRFRPQGLSRRAIGAIVL
jgi:hypothetical protein